MSAARMAVSRRSTCSVDNTALPRAPRPDPHGFGTATTSERKWTPALCARRPPAWPSPRRHSSRAPMPEEWTVAEVGRLVSPQDPLLARTGRSAMGQVATMPTPTDCLVMQIRSPKLPVCSREEFRAPAGVRKSPRKEPASHRQRLWGFRYSAGVGDGATAAGKHRDGCGRTASLSLRAILSARQAARHGSVGVDDHHGRAAIRCR